MFAFLPPSHPIHGRRALLIAMIICLPADLVTGFTFVGFLWGLLVAAIVLVGNVLLALALKKTSLTFLYSFMPYDFLITVFTFAAFACTFYLDLMDVYLVYSYRIYAYVMTGFYVLFSFIHIVAFVDLCRLAGEFP